VEARFQRLAALVPQEDWQTLVAGTTDAVFKRLAACGALDAATPETMGVAYNLVGQLLVDYTNVVLTSVAAAELSVDQAQ
jgi:hypothetical protein